MHQHLTCDSESQEDHSTPQLYKVSNNLLSIYTHSATDGLQLVSISTPILASVSESL